MKLKFNQGFRSEWEKLAEVSDQKFSFGNRPPNISKNRYANAPTFDGTRVVLQQQHGKQESTYINANFIDDIERPKAYIATQAPLPETVSDFWRMVWEQEVRYIVMVGFVLSFQKIHLKFGWFQLQTVVTEKYELEIPKARFVLLTLSNMSTMFFTSFILVFSMSSSTLNVQL